MRSLLLSSVMILFGCTTVEDCKCDKGAWFETENKCVAGLWLVDPCWNAPQHEVCGCDRKTYMNECEARMSGVKKFSDGQCKAETILDLF